MAGDDRHLICGHADVLRLLSIYYRRYHRKVKSVVEKRRYPRRVARFSAKYTVPSGTYRDLVGNVGAGGVFILSRQTVLPGQRISIQFPIFALHSKPSVIGTVLRCQKHGFAVIFQRPVHGRICPADFYPFENSGESATTGKEDGEGFDADR